MPAGDINRKPTDAETTPAMPELLWHYTDAAGLLGILGGGAGQIAGEPVARFWATGIEYLNDHQELVHGLKFVRDTLANFIAEFRAITYRPDEPHIFVNIPGKVAFLEHLRDGITAVIDGTYPYSIHCYVTSFSTEPDLLSQWRGYGAGLDGYALAINPAGLTEQGGHPLRPGGHFAPVHYGHGAAADQIGAEVVGRLHQLLVPTEAPSASDQMVNQSLRWIAVLASRLKHQGFREEAEWRLIEPGYADGASYRTRGTSLIPYSTWSLKGDRIMGVKVGPSPTQKQNVRAVRGFLYRNGFVTAAENVTWSDTPFR